ncbi:MAG: hypothetical protein FWC86_02100 [Coriobacteriia bacterium]|nr:hypothetical protein [Coriobacteriia bacterium]
MHCYKKDGARMKTWASESLRDLLAIRRLMGFRLAAITTTLAVVFALSVGAIATAAVMGGLGSVDVADTSTVRTESRAEVRLAATESPTPNHLNLPEATDTPALQPELDGVEPQGSESESGAAPELEQADLGPLVLINPVPSNATVTVTLRIEYREDTKLPPTEITFAHRDWSEFGIVDADDPGYITPLHVLAEGLDYKYGEGSAEDLIVASGALGGFLSALGDSSGSNAGAENSFWAWTANQAMPLNATTGWGYGAGEYEVQDGDVIEFLGSWAGQWGLVSPWVTFFDEDAFNIDAGESFELQLLGLDFFDLDDLGVPPTTGIADAEILIDPVSDSRLGATTASDIFTDEEGLAEITLTEPGTYLLSAARITSSDINDITRPFAKVTVEGNQGQEPGLPGAHWNSFRGNTSNSAVVNAATPTTSQETTVVWTERVGPGGVTSPVKLGDYIYVAAQSSLQKFNAAGQVQATAQLAEPAGIVTLIAASDDQIFVPLDSGRVQAFDADTLEESWISSEDYLDDSWEALGALNYKDGYLYGAAGFDMFNIQSDGYFFCLDADTGQKVWTYSSSAGTPERGFYWSGAAITEDFVLFAGDDGLLVSHPTGDTQSTRVAGALDTALLPGGVRSPVLYLEGTDGAGIAYATTRNGYVARVEVAADGTLGQVTSERLSGAMSTSTPVEYRNRLYTVSGARFENGFVDVFDATTLEHLRSIELPGFSQSSPLLSTFAANDVNGYEAHLYLMLNDLRDDVIRVTDSERANAAMSFEVMFSPGGQQSLNSLTADSNGRLFFVDGQGSFTVLATDSSQEGGPGAGNGSGGDGNNGGGDDGTGGDNNNNNNNGGNDNSGNDTNNNGTGSPSEDDDSSDGQNSSTGGSSTTTQTAKPSDENTRAAGAGPKTADYSNAMRWIFLAAMAGTIAIAVIASKISDRKKAKMEELAKQYKGTEESGSVSSTASVAKGMQSKQGAIS